MQLVASYSLHFYCVDLILSEPD